MTVFLHTRGLSFVSPLKLTNAYSNEKAFVVLQLLSHFLIITEFFAAVGFGISKDSKYNV